MSVKWQWTFPSQFNSAKISWTKLQTIAFKISSVHNILQQDTLHKYSKWQQNYKKHIYSLKGTENIEGKITQNYFAHNLLFSILNS